MNRIEIVTPFRGLFYMIVCAEKDVTDEEILAFCNKENPSGTTAGWGNVIRDGRKDQMPIPCADNPSERLHFMVGC